MEQNEQVQDQVQDLMEETNSEWMVTYADLMTLLLVFFVLLYSISSLNLSKYKTAVSSIQVSLGESEPSVGLLELLDGTEKVDQEIKLEDVVGLRSMEKQLIKDIHEMISEKKVGDHIVTMISNGKIIVQIRGKVLFDSGAAELNQEALPILDRIVKIVREYNKYNVNIRGHTDNVPISTEKFASNWELSAIRATTVLKYLIQAGIDPGRMTATGYGDFLPLNPNDTDEHRAINRRVEFVLEKKAE